MADTLNVIYKRKSATVEDICSHLTRCKDLFIPALNSRVTIADYAQKIQDKSMTFEAWVNQTLIGLVAADFNDQENKSGFVTDVSVETEFARRGIASQLLASCIGYAKENMYKEIGIEVHQDNSGAIDLYKKFGFSEIGQQGQMRTMKRILRVSHPQ